MKKTLVILAAVLLVGAAAAAVQRQTRSPHPNLFAAQRLTQQAFDKVKAAQLANEFDRSGHAQAAQEYLEQASAQLKLAAEAAEVSVK